MQDFTAVENNHELEQCAEKPEIGIASDGQMQDPIRADKLNLPETR